MNNILGLRHNKKDSDKEEITIHDVNRIGSNLEKDLDAILTIAENPNKTDEEIKHYVDIYTKKIDDYNQFVRETNEYAVDHILHYFKTKDNKLSYKAIKKSNVGFIHES